jgi:hypothetical protein
MFVTEGDVFGLELVKADASAAAELASLRGIMQRFPSPPKGTSLHLDALEGKCVVHSFMLDAADRLFIKTKVFNNDEKDNLF